MESQQHPLLKTLNLQQQAAVTATIGPILVIAGPGSGKTRVLTHRIAWMLTEFSISPWHVLAVTFTNKAAREMAHRLEGMLGANTARSMGLGTFHATCARILRREAQHIGRSANYLIFDTSDQETVMKQVVSDLNLDDKRYRPRALLGAVSQAKNDLVPASDYPINTYYDEIVARAYDRYQATLQKNDALDFDDLLMETANLLRHHPEVLAHYRDRYQHILVDEFQDTNVAQYVILRLLSEAHRSAYVVADEDQSIYSWRGADYRNIERLRKDYTGLTEYLLEENYRSTQVILDAAQAIIAPNPDRTPKHLFTRKRGGTPVTLQEAYDEQTEADYVAQEVIKLARDGYTYGHIAVMYRTNAQSRALEESFVRKSVPYRLIGATRFYSRAEIKDILAFLRLIQNPDDDVSFGRVINVPPRGIGARTLSQIAEQARQHNLSRYQGLVALLASEGTTGRAQKALAAFVNLLNSWLEQREQSSVAQLIDRVLMDTGYESHLRDGSDEGESRWENIQSLRGVVADAPDISLTEFLTDVALVADVDELSAEVDAVTLLTLHSAKGLEYPVVFLTGLEEGMLPHSRSLESPSQVAEERRLLYVGMTRAQEKLYLTYAFRRGWGGYGGSEPAAPSRFLEDLPPEVLGKSPRAQRQGMQSRWRSSDEPIRSKLPQSAPRPQQQYKSGQRVHHSHYGNGIVLESQVEGRNEMVTVLFAQGIGVKKLLGSMAPMEPVPEH